MERNRISRRYAGGRRSFSEWNGQRSHSGRRFPDGQWTAGGRRFPGVRPFSRILAVWLTVFALAFVCAATALAVPADGVYNYILDGADILDEEARDMLEEYAAFLAEEYGFAPYVVTESTLSGVAADDKALSYYDEYAMGAGDSRVGAILLVDATDGAYSIQVMNAETPDADALESLYWDTFADETTSWFDCFAAYLEGCSDALSAAEDGVTRNPETDGDTGGADGDYILDMADLLTEDEEDALEERAGSIVRSYHFAPCVVTVDGLDGWDVEDLTRSYYTEYKMGIGEDNNGAILLLSMEDRDFWLLVEDHENKVFDVYRYESVQQAFLPSFKQNDWYDGFSEYLNAVEHYLSGAADDVDREAGEDWNYYGDYVPDYADDGGSTLIGVLVVVGIPVLIALLISLGLLLKMTTVRTASSADSYVTGNGLNLRIREDVYTHTTETRVKVESDNDSGGGSHGGGGGGSFSGGGKF